MTAAVCFDLYPVAASPDMPRRTGVPVVLAPIARHGAATLDLAFGVLTLLPHGCTRQPLWVVQTVSSRLGRDHHHAAAQHWFIHSAPKSKNLPMLAALALRHEREAVTSGERE